MTVERRGSPELNRDILIAYAQTFIPRFDRYPQQLADGSYHAVHKELKLDTIRQHLWGEVTLGAYALDRDSRAQWVCLDADEEEEWLGLRELSKQLHAEHQTSYLEPSRRGGHLWIFFDQPLPGADVRRFAKQLLFEQDIPTVEIYPKQDKLQTGAGSLVRLPLGIHRKSNRRYHLVDLSGNPIAPSIRDQMRLLTYPKRVSTEYVNVILALAPDPKPLPNPLSFDGKTTTPNPSAEVSTRIKSSISVYDFVSQFVELDRNSVGLCPFHDDHQCSFNVERERNYWHCFTSDRNPQCKGQTVIDFWMNWRGIDFKQAVKELAAMFL